MSLPQQAKASGLQKLEELSKTVRVHADDLKSKDVSSSTKLASLVDMHVFQMASSPGSTPQPVHLYSVKLGSGESETGYS